jgi:CHAT domain-containing protein
MVTRSILGGRDVSRLSKQLMRVLDRAEDTYRAGDLAATWDAASQVLADAVNCGDANERALLRARAYEMQAVILQDRGESQRALHCYQTAEDELLNRPAHRVFLGRVQISLMQQCAMLGLDGDAVRYLAKARENVAGSEYEQYLAGWEGGGAGAAKQDGWRERAAALDEEVSELEREGQKRRADRNMSATEDARIRRILALRRQIAAMRIRFGTDEEAADGFIMIGSIADALFEVANDYREFLELTTAMSFLLDRPNLSMAKLVGHLAECAFAGGSRNQAPEMVGQAHYLSAITAVKMGDEPKALSHALSAVAFGLDCLALTQSTLLRAELKQRLDERRDLALTLAVAINDPAVAAELIETDRLQSLPEAGTQLNAAATPADLRETLHATWAALGSLDHVSVRGRSELYGRSSEYFPQPRNLVALEDAITEVGGPGAWWWGAFAVLRRIHWVVRSPDGTMRCGTRQLSEVEVNSVNTYDADLKRVISGRPVWHDSEHEKNVLGDLSDVLLPDPLRHQLLAESGDLSLVVCGNWLAAMPLAALVVDRSSDLRLVETAVIRVQPPAFLVNLMRQRPLPASGNHPLLIACTDPTGDLDNAHSPDLPALFAFTNKCHGPRARSEATRANVAAALSRLPPSAPGIFYYAGHAGYFDVTGGLNAVLLLQDGDVIGAGDWLHLYGQPDLNSPCRAVISACNSAGTSGAGGGEWLGLGAALLAAGARQVLATAWPIFDTRFGNRFDTSMVAELKEAPDPAATLAAAQRGALNEWRNARSRFPEDAPLPEIWAAYQCIGLRT